MALKGFTGSTKFALKLTYSTKFALLGHSLTAPFTPVFVGNSAFTKYFFLCRFYFIAVTRPCLVPAAA